jgi:hypothetical protein
MARTGGRGAPRNRLRRWRTSAAPGARGAGHGFIGVEPFVNSMAKMLASLETDAVANIRVYDDDATQVLDWLPDAAIDRIDLLYPDPWPKMKHWKRRFVSQANLDRFARVLKPGGLFCFASDIDTYVNWTLPISPPIPISNGPRERPGTGASPGQAGPAPATRPRRSARVARLPISNSSGRADPGRSPCIHPNAVRLGPADRTADPKLLAPAAKSRYRISKFLIAMNKSGPARTRSFLLPFDEPSQT